MSGTPRNPANSQQNATNHVDEVTGLLYIEGQLEQQAARDVVAHLGHCAACRLLLDSLKRESLLLREALIEEDEAVPASLLSPQPSHGLSWGWLTAFVLAGLGAYSLWSFYVEPSLENLQQSGFGGQFIFTWILLNGALWKGWNDMLQFLIYGSIAVLASLLLFLVRRNLRRFASLSIFLGALVPLTLLHPPAAHASEFVKQESSYEIRSGETLKSDLFILAPSVRIEGTLDGDLVCFCHNLFVEGHVTGDVIVFSNSVYVAGKVDGSIRSFSEHLTIEGSVSRNVLSFVNEFETTPRSNVQGSTTLFVGHMRIDGPIGKSLSAYVGEGNINAPIGGDVWIRGAQDQHERHRPLVVSDGADIKGNFRYRGSLRPEISSQARLAGAPKIDIVTERPAYMRTGSYWYNAMIWGMAFIVGLVLISVAPGFVRETSREVARIGAPLGLGLLFFIALPIAGVIACITVVGLGLGMSAIFLWLFLLCFGQVFTAVWLGEAILGATSGVWPVTGRLALGLLVIRVATLIPGIGLLVRIVACVMGVGGIVLVIYRRLQARGTPPPAMAVTPAITNA
jgi:hypothetical protein